MSFFLNIINKFLNKEEENKEEKKDEIHDKIKEIYYDEISILEHRLKICRKYENKNQIKYIKNKIETIYN